MSSTDTDGLVRRLLHLIRRTAGEWRDDDAMRWGAAIAYYSVISLAPLVVLATSLLGRVMAGERAEEWILQQVRLLAGPQVRDVASTVLEESSRLDFASLGSVATMVLLLFGATAVFANLQRALNQVWSVEPRSGLLRDLARTRISAFVTVLVLGALMALSVAAGAIIGGVAPLIEGLAPYVPLLLIGDIVASTLALWLAVSAVFWVLPDVRISWRDVWMGALVTALLLVVGRVALAAFLARNAFASMYGTAGSILLLLLWVYYSTQVFFFGAEFTQVWAEEQGREIEPEDYAVRIERVVRSSPMSSSSA